MTECPDCGSKVECSEKCRAIVFKRRILSELKNTYTWEGMESAWHDGIGDAINIIENEEV